ncbi:MAG TPA: response regulator transcription factor [Verrucomicrobiae bacterium]|nr:response regulator transcription factor [Verrucomicrobiae bacterium]
MEETVNVTVVLADDQTIVREGFAALFRERGIQILGQASDGAQALEMIQNLKPDFAILDLQMPGMSGAEVIRRLRASAFPGKLVILSFSQEESTVMEALRAGADGYVLKDGPFRHLLDAINFIREGGIYVSPLLHGAGIFGQTPGRLQPDPVASLSPREMEVFQYLVNGLRAKDIAELLDISPKTVDTYRASLMRKLNVRDLVGLVKFAIERNLTSTSGQTH